MNSPSNIFQSKPQVEKYLHIYYFRIFLVKLQYMFPIQALFCMFLIMRMMLVGSESEFNPLDKPDLYPTDIPMDLKFKGILKRSHICISENRTRHKEHPVALGLSFLADLDPWPLVCSRLGCLLEQSRFLKKNPHVYRSAIPRDNTWIFWSYSIQKNNGNPVAFISMRYLVLSVNFFSYF